MNVPDGKKLAFWGIGYVCKLCRNSYPTIVPEIYIDSKKNGLIFDNKQIISPEEVENWKQLFVIITMRDAIRVEEELKCNNMKQDVDYQYYEDFFGTNEETIDDNIKTLINSIDLVKMNNNYKDIELLYTPCLFVMRHNQVWINFINKYIESNHNKKLVILTRFEGASTEYINNRVHTLVVNYPFIRESLLAVKRNYSYDSQMLKNNMDDEEKKLINDLSKNLITDLAQDDVINYTQMQYLYLRKVISIINPSRVLSSGGYTRQGFIINYLTKKYRIPQMDFEHGQISGTIQFDLCGLEAYSEYYLFHDKFKYVKDNNENEFVRSVKEYIKKTHIDSGDHMNIDTDNEQLKKINPDMKTVFFAGMGDSGMGIIPGNRMWKELVSSCVNSTYEAFVELMLLCKEYGFNFIFKPHPNANDDYFTFKNEVSEDVVLIQSKSIDELIMISDVVVTIVSAVSYKTLIYEKPLLLLGNSPLIYYNCAFYAREKSEIRNTLLTAMEEGMTNNRIESFDSFMSLLLKRSLWDDLTHPDFPYGRVVEDGLIIDNSDGLAYSYF